MLREEVRGALHEFDAALAGGDEGGRQVEEALHAQVDREMLATKADKTYCESLLGRFAVEVGRQLSDMEESHMSVQQRLEAAVDDP